MRLILAAHTSGAGRLCVLLERGRFTSDLRDADEQQARRQRPEDFLVILLTVIREAPET